MKLKTHTTLLMVGLVLAAVAGVYLLRARTPASPGQAPVESGVSIPQPVPASQNDNAAAAEAARRSETAAAYAGLEASRKTLQKELSDLKSALWGRELPADQARNISRDMMSAQYLLRNPPLLGAFSDAAGVQAEKDRVDAAQVRLQEISRTLGEGKSQ